MQDEQEDRHAEERHQDLERNVRAAHPHRQVAHRQGDGDRAVPDRQALQEPGPRGLQAGPGVAQQELRPGLRVRRGHLRGGGGQCEGPRGAGQEGRRRGREAAGPGAEGRRGDVRLPQGRQVRRDPRHAAEGEGGARQQAGGGREAEAREEGAVEAGHRAAARRLTERQAAN